MKILLVGPNSIDTPINSLSLLLNPEHTVKIFDPMKHLGLPGGFGGQLSLVTQAWAYLLRGIIREPFKIANKYLEKEVRNFQPDLIFIISIQSILPETIEKIKKESDAIVVGWFMDAISNFERGYFFVSDYDCLFFKDKYIVDLLRNKFSTSIIHYLPQCCDPNLHRPIQLTAEEEDLYRCDLTIAGNIYNYRVRMLEQFSDYNMKIWGHKQNWVKTRLHGNHMNRPVYGLEKSKAMRAAKIVLNNNHYAEIAGINKRTFEVAACGAFQITDGPGLVDVFKPDYEIVTFDTKKDLKEKVDYYLAHPDERREFADRAQKRAHAEHTYAHRWQYVLRTVNKEVKLLSNNLLPDLQQDLVCNSKLVDQVDKVYN